MITFFTQNRWAFATIHYSLSNYLYACNINTCYIDYSVGYRMDEFNLIKKMTSIFMTQPDAVPSLRTYDVSWKKIVIVAHSEWDLKLALKYDPDIFNNVLGYVVISNNLYDKSIEFGIKRRPEVLRVGINTTLYHSPPSKMLKTIGYAGAFETYNFDGMEIKRGRLVPEIISLANMKCGNALKYFPHQYYIWQSMPGYYDSVDAILITSIEEAASVPLMEAMAAGRMVFTTNVGYAKSNELPSHLSDIIVILDKNLSEDEFKEKMAEEISYYHNNPYEFGERCIKAKNFARSYFDWISIGKNWIEYLRNLKMYL